VATFSAPTNAASSPNASSGQGTTNLKRCNCAVRPSEPLYFTSTPAICYVALL
jgi:hypothetical protein